MFHEYVTLADAVMAVLLVEASMHTSAELLGVTSAMHADFPEDPDELYKTQEAIILKKLGLDQEQIPPEEREYDYEQHLNSQHQPEHGDGSEGGPDGGGGQYEGEVDRLLNEAPREDFRKREEDAGDMGFESEGVAGTDEHASDALPAEPGDSSIPAPFQMPHSQITSQQSSESGSQSGSHQQQASKRSSKMVVQASQEDEDVENLDQGW
jgi:hypothetical protein